jgi:hypothetical protein
MAKGKIPAALKGFQFKKKGAKTSAPKAKGKGKAKGGYK